MLTYACNETWGDVSIQHMHQHNNMRTSARNATWGTVTITQCLNVCWLVRRRWTRFVQFIYFHAEECSCSRSRSCSRFRSRSRSRSRFHCRCCCRCRSRSRSCGLSHSRSRSLAPLSLSLAPSPLTSSPPLPFPLCFQCAHYSLTWTSKILQTHLALLAGFWSSSNAATHLSPTVNPVQAGGPAL